MLHQPSGTLVSTLQRGHLCIGMLQLVGSRLYLYQSFEHTSMSPLKYRNEI